MNPNCNDASTHGPLFLLEDLFDLGEVAYLALSPRGTFETKPRKNGATSEVDENHHAAGTTSLP